MIVRRRTRLVGGLVLASTWGALAGCGLAHAGGVDAGPSVDASAEVPAIDTWAPDPPDARAPDSFVCPDRDGDGALDARCGGDDCDDSSPTVVPGATRCDTPTSFETCIAGSFSRTACGGATPDCDARTGACAASACGDGVVHPDEQCDFASASFRCDDECRVRCSLQSDCHQFAPGTTCGHFEGTLGHCASGGDVPVGASCVVDEECASGWCDAVQARCSMFCVDADCGPQAVCDHHAATWDPRPMPESLPLCVHACARNADCPSSSVCALTAFYPMGPAIPSGRCYPPHGDGLLGEACGAMAPCQSDSCLDGVCTRPCVDDSDCEGGAPHCVVRDISDQFGVRPGGVPAIALCTP